MSKRLGYARVSTRRQNLDRQLDALAAAGIDKVFQDKISGTKFVRAGLDELLAYAREGDVVIVQSLDRLGRSLGELIRTADELLKRGIVLKSLTEGIDYSTPTGRMVAGIFASLAEYERELILERAADARAAARSRGKQTRRPPALTADQGRQLRALHASGESAGDLAKTFGVGRATVYRALADATA